MVTKIGGDGQYVLPQIYHYQVVRFTNRLKRAQNHAVFNYRRYYRLVADYPASHHMYVANLLWFIPCPRVSISLILLLGMIIFPVSSLMYLDVPGIDVLLLNPSSGAASARAEKRVSTVTMQ